jgi:hypothetical protein
LNRPTEIRDVIGPERQCAHSGGAKPRRSRAIVLAGVKNYEVGMRSEHNLHIRLESIAEVRHEPGCSGPKIELRAANKARSGTEGKKHFGRHGIQRHDTRRRLSDTHRISEVVTSGRDLGARFLAGGDRKRAGDQDTEGSMAENQNGHSSQRNARNEHAPKRRLAATRTSPEVL